MIAGIFLLANYVWAIDAQLLAEIDKYDPGTPEAERASEEWASDTDRSFLLLLSPVLTGVWYSGLFLLLFGLQRVIRQMFPAKYASVALKRTVRLQSNKAMMEILTNHQSPDNNCVNRSGESGGI